MSMSSYENCEECTSETVRVGAMWSWLPLIFEFLTRKIARSDEMSIFKWRLFLFAVPVDVIFSLQTPSRCHSKNRWLVRYFWAGSWIEIAPTNFDSAWLSFSSFLATPTEWRRSLGTVLPLPTPLPAAFQPLNIDCSWQSPRNISI